MSIKTKIKVSDLDLKTQVIQIKRVTKVMKGGRVLSFSALVVLGDKSKVVGFGFGKAKDVTKAIAKATKNAYKTLTKMPIIHGTIPHGIQYKYKASYIFLKPVAPGTGIIAGKTMRAVLEYAGVSDVIAKTRGSNNAHNIVFATFMALKSLETAYQVAKRRGITLEKVFNG